MIAALHITAMHVISLMPLTTFIVFHIDLQNSYNFFSVMRPPLAPTNLTNSTFESQVLMESIHK